MNFFREIFNKKKHNMLFFVLLWFLPIIALNVGYGFISKIHGNWAVQKQKEIAHLEVEALAAGSDFTFQFTKHAGEFEKLFKGYAESLPESNLLKPYIETSVSKTFGPLFPDYDLFVFHLPEKGRGDVLFNKSDGVLMRRAYTAAFKYMVDVNKGNPISPTEKNSGKNFLLTILNSPIDVDAIVKSQRAKHTYSFYKLDSFSFFWNFFELPSKGTFGYFLFCKNDPSYEINGRKIALETLADNPYGAVGAFYPLFENYGEPIFQNEILASSKLLERWASETLPKDDTELNSWVKKEMPNGVQLGNYTLYSSIGEGQTHLAVLLIPNATLELLPPWLHILTLIYVGILFLVIFKGLFMGVWPEISLKYRFIVSYLLASVLPVSLLVITLYGYLIQFREASYLQSLANLQASINEFDSRKTQLLEDYNSVFKEVLSDETLKEILANEGVHSRVAIDRILEHYFHGSEKLPLVSVRIFDESGEGATVVFDRDGNELPERLYNVENLLYPLASNLRKHKLEAKIEESLVKKMEPSVEQKLAMEAYYSMAKYHLDVRLDERRSLIITNEEGGRLSLHMHDYLYVDDMPYCCLVIRWDDQALDGNTYEATENYLSLKNPEFSFVAYRAEPQGLELFKEASRHISTENLAKLKQQAQLAVFKNSFSRSQEGNLFFYAVPSKKYKDLIFVGSGSVDQIVSAAHIRYIILLVILILTIIVIVSCSYISSKVILEPISGLKEALDEVAENRLALEITSENQDELGQLCYRFSTMVEGLREREKLATLISDQAVEAISKTGGDFVTETFDGVALVSDIRGFTAACEKYDPALVTELLNEHFAEMSKIISEQGGRIYKYIGDAIEAVFPEDERYSESACLRAFNAASRMVVKLVQINQQRRKRKLFTYRIGIGLKYGQMHSGAVGSLDTRLDYVIVGDTLKKAAELESLSVVNVAFPIVIDSKINRVLSYTGLSFEPISGKENLDAYVLNNLGAVDFDMNLEEESKGAKASEMYKPSQVGYDKFRYIKAGEGLGLPGRYAFIGGLLFIVLTSLIGLLGYETVVKTKLDATKLNMHHLNVRLIDQFKPETSIRLGFENICRVQLKEIEQLANTVESHEELAKLTAEIGDSFKDKGYIDRYLVCTYSGKGSMVNARELARHRISKRSMSTLSGCMLKLNWAANDPSIRNLLVKVFDESMMKRWIEKEIVSTVFEAGISDYEKIGEGVELASELVYLDYFHNYKTNSSGNPPIKGYVFFSKDLGEKKYAFLDLLVQGYSVGQDDLHIAMAPHVVAKQGVENWTLSEGFPKKLLKSLGKEAPSNGDGDWIVYREVVEINDEKISVFVARDVPLELKGNYLAVCSSTVLVVAFLIYILYGIVRRRSFVTKSVAAKLWLALISVSIIPIITVYFLFQLYLNEEENVRIAHKQMELQGFLRRFELVQSFTNPSGWKNIELFSFSDEARGMIAEASKDSTELEGSDKLNVSALNAVVNGWLETFESCPSSRHFNVKEVIVSTHDWKGSVHLDDSSSDFGKLLGEIAFRLTKLAKDSGDANFAEAKEEMILDASLNMLRSNFGDDIYVKMPNAVRAPITMKVATSNVGVVIHVVPDLKDAEYTMLWLMIFDNKLHLIAEDYNAYQNRLIDSGDKGSLGEKDSGFRVFATTIYDRGQVNSGKFFKDRDFFKKLVNYVIASNLPISTTFKSDGIDYLVEVVMGVNTSTDVLLGLTSKMDVITDLQNARVDFFWALGLSLFLIVLIANNIAKDILIPVKELIQGMVETNKENYAYRIGIERKDELGVLCTSFDDIMKGLEERMLMRKMLSGTAQKETLRAEESESKKADCVLLYTGVPDFSSYMNSMETERLFLELKRHVAGVAEIILSEGGEIDKIIGDKQLIAFYVENNDMGAAIEKAVKASLRICRAESSGSLPFPIAIGVSAGSVVTGFLGVGEKRDFTLIGDTVNTAARIEALAEKQRVDRCLIAENVYESVKEKYPGSFLGEIELKGKEQALKVYSLFGD